MKAMLLAFVAAAAITVVADVVLDEIGFASAERSANGSSVRLGD